ncbi:DUF6328 family protein [Streptomyces violaceus]|uniref:DUF6328 family protein n=1 Tax=Streptomyces violaceus TaxID=1936 RepID=A0ABY9UIW4_STRVL|nr:DUF6328 family protein [Streptomyces janthinus]WND22523.1 DUF6328 family protein [Streptomyces janthinus]GGS85979.1 hypothetical protein GCM10010270_67670 [Streptomyces janthinus]
MAEHSPCTARGETPLQRADRNFVELLQELRVTQTGVQILFAFLLSLAFTSRFSSLDTAQRVTYVSTLLLAVLAAALFTAPAALHRSLFQQGAKPRIVQVSSRLATTGLIVLVFAFSGSVLLVVDVTTGRAGGIAAGAATFLVCVGLWGLLPRLVRRAGLRQVANGGCEEREPAVEEATLRGTVRIPAPRRGGSSRREASLRRR